MTNFIGVLFSLAAPRADDRVTLEDIESHLRSLGGDATQAIASKKNSAILAAGFGAVVVLAGAYLQGRRKGKNRASVLEVRRI